MLIDKYIYIYILYIDVYCILWIVASYRQDIIIWWGTKRQPAASFNKNEQMSMFIHYVLYIFDHPSIYLGIGLLVPDPRYQTQGPRPKVTTRMSVKIPRRAI